MATIMTHSDPNVTAPTARRRILWVDGVGGYLLVDRDEVSVGQAIAESSTDIGIVGVVERCGGEVDLLGSQLCLAE